MRIVLNLCLVALLAMFSQSCKDDDVMEVVDCEVKFAINEKSCSSFTFYNVDQLMMDWEVNGEFIDRSQQFSYEASRADTYTICGIFEKPGCPIDTLCEVIEVSLDCIPNDACSVELLNTENSCSSFSFSNSQQVVMAWSVNDSLFTTAEIFDFEAALGGTYEICGFFETPDCPAGGEDCITIEVGEDCFADTQNEACDTALNMNSISCSSFSFSNNIEVIMDWSVNDSLVTTAEVFDYEAQIAGTYEICGFFETPECPAGGQACITVEVAEDCFTNEACEVELSMIENSCSSFSFGNSKGISMDWFVSGSLVTSGEVFDFEAQEAGSYEICGFFETPDCPEGSQACNTVEVADDCFTNEACEVELNMTENSCSSFSFGNSRQVIMDWSVNDSLVTTAEVFDFEAQEAGSYEICGLFETPECPEGGEDCVTVVVEEDCFVDEACEVELQLEDISCSSFFVSNNRQVVMDYRVNGELVATTMLYTFEAQEAGTYEICGLFETPECPEGGQDCVSLDIPEDCF